MELKIIGTFAKTLYTGVEVHINENTVLSATVEESDDQFGRNIVSITLLDDVLPEGYTEDEITQFIKNNYNDGL